VGRKCFILGASDLFFEESVTMFDCEAEYALRCGDKPAARCSRMYPTDFVGTKFKLSAEEKSAFGPYIQAGSAVVIK